MNTHPNNVLCWTPKHEPIRARTLMEHRYDKRRIIIEGVAKANSHKFILQATVQSEWKGKYGSTILIHHEEIDRGDWVIRDRGPLTERPVSAYY